MRLLSSAIAWNLIKLDATKILCNLTERDITKQDDGNYKVTFKYDLSDKNPIGRDIISSEDTFPDNALFFQLRKILTADSKREIDENFMRSSLIFVDFKDVFLKKEWSSVKLPVNIPSKDDLRTDKALIKKMEWLFENGLDLSFDGKNFKRFVPFDKSSSMSRSCQITFLDLQIKEALDKRLMLDMDFTKIPLELSKFYAYRGLYLSTSYRVEALPKKDFSLNEETVIVIPDYETVLKKKITFSASEQNTLWEYGTKEENLEVNLFDGEGLISPDFAEHISNFLNDNYDFLKPSHSFQVRMPFTKGVLHEVDFNKFLSDYLPVKTERYIKDFFGIIRDLSKAKIILTKSMFKCAKWMKELWERDSNLFASDPMKFFFEKFAKYNHALYVTTTEARLSNPGRVRLNYQFLSTLALSVEDFDSLVADQRTVIDSFAEKFATSFSDSSCLEDFTNEMDDELDSEEIILRSSAARTTCLKTLAKNPAFLQDRKVKNISEDIQKNYECNLGLGRLEVEGEQRFLSCDLLVLLIKILENVQNFRLDEITKKSLKKACLYQDRFFMPKNKLLIKPDKNYVFLRNPHLSRNEQVLLRSYVNRSSLYEKYFSTLKGVVMVSAYSTAALALGGADFDGDLVKIIPDKRIVQAVKKDNLDFALPPIKIPSVKPMKSNLGDNVSPQVIVDTFSSKVGLISNWAVTLSKKEYFSDTIEEKYKNVCAKCTIVVGLEIDAAKSGNHPEENIKELEELKKSCNENIFLKSKKIIERINQGHYSPIVNCEKDNFILYLSKYDKKPSLQAPLGGENTSILERLPVYYLRFIFERASNSDTSEESLNLSKKFFNFEVPAWRQSLDKSLRAELEKLIKAYTSILSLARKTQYIKNSIRGKNFGGYIVNILKIQYDDYRHQKLSCGVELETALEQLYAEISFLLKTKEKVQKAIEALKNRKWHFTREEDRPSVAAEILGLNPSNDEKLPPAFELLYNFRCNGFMLFYFLLKDLESYLCDEVEFISQNNSTDNDDEYNQNPYRDELRQIYSESIAAKKSKRIWNAQLIKICRQHLKKIFDGNMYEALKYYWSKKSKDDSSRNFFWNVFTEQEILSQIFIPQKQD